MLQLTVCHSMSRKWQCLCTAFLTACVFLAPVHTSCQIADAGQKTQKGKKEQRENSLRQMSSRAKNITLLSLVNEKRVAAKLVAQPVFRYSDQPRFILDATLWAWSVGGKGRPVAICKIEGYRANAESAASAGNANAIQPQWLYNLASLSTGLIEAEWSFGHRWNAKKPNLTLVTLVDGPKPSNSKIARLRQLKAISRRFSATISKPAVENEMRLLPQPIHRYSDQDAGLRDGAIFGFANNGTNPDTLFVVELYDKNGSMNWKFGVIGMTMEAVSVRLDDKQVWMKPATERRGAQDTWTFFFKSEVVNEE